MSRYKSNSSRQKLRQSNITPKPSFKSWMYELIQKAKSKRIKIELEEDSAKMYYFGGYSPKMTICDILNIPFENYSNI